MGPRGFMLIAFSSLSTKRCASSFGNALKVGSIFAFTVICMCSSFDILHLGRFLSTINLKNYSRFFAFLRTRAIGFGPAVAFFLLAQIYRRIFYAGIVLKNY